MILNGALWAGQKPNASPPAPFSIMIFAKMALALSLSPALHLSK